MENTYWHNAGKHQTVYAELCDTLIPMSGACDTAAGEMLRSVTRLAYDLYNNGMGNNTSGAANYLLAKGVIDAETHGVIYPYTRGALYDGHYEGDAFQRAVESAIDQTVEHILNNPELKTTPNSDDMFELEEEFQTFCEECGDETDARGFYSHLCRYCEDAQLAADEEEEDDCYA